MSEQFKMTAIFQDGVITFGGKFNRFRYLIRKLDENYTKRLIDVIPEIAGVL